MPLSVTVVTLTTFDLERAKVFYSGLGFKLVYDKRNLAFFDAGSLHLAICHAEVLANDLGENEVVQTLKPTSGDLCRIPRQVLSLNVDSADQVSSTLEDVKRLHGLIIKSASAVQWGGTRGYFADPDQHVWEVVHNPKWQKDSGGKLVIPE